MSKILSLSSRSIPSLYLAGRGSLLKKNPSRPLRISGLNHRPCRILNQGLQWGILGCQLSTTVTHAAMGDIPGATPPPPPNFPAWATWILGTIVSLILPVWKLKGGFLGKIGKTVEEVAETVEDVAEVVEDVAEAVEKISSEVADGLPEDGILKDAASWIEEASKEVKEDARHTLEFIHKVEGIAEEAEKDFKELMGSKSEEESEEGEIKGRKAGESEKAADGKEEEERGKQEIKEKDGNKEIADEEGGGKKGTQPGNTKVEKQ